MIVEKESGTAKPAVVREYDINGTRYIVRATVKDGANEDAAAKVRRLIRNEVSRAVEITHRGRQAADSML